MAIENAFPWIQDFCDNGYCGQVLLKQQVAIMV